MVKSKKGQFFILAAIIIVSAIIGLTIVKNYVSIGELPINVDRYSREFGFESGAIVDYILYSGTSGSYLGSFYNESISSALITKYPDMEVYVCYGNKTILNCENWGKKDINISVDGRAVYFLEGGSKMVNNGLCATGSCQNSEVENRIQNPNSVKKSFSSVNVTNITILTADLNYTLDLTKAVQSNQFYLVFKQNSSAGTVISDTSKQTPSVSFAPAAPEEATNAETPSK